jgi:hypothetical protein
VGRGLVPGGAGPHRRRWSSPATAKFEPATSAAQRGVREARGRLRNGSRVTGAQAGFCSRKARGRSSNVAQRRSTVGSSWRSSGPENGPGGGEARAASAACPLTAGPQAHAGARRTVMYRFSLFGPNARL